MDNTDMQVVKAVHLVIDESEEIMLMEALYEYLCKRQKQRPSEMRDAEMHAAHSFLKKIGKQLYGKQA